MSSPSTSPTAMPVVFISHGAPLVAIEQGPYQTALRGFAQGLHPKAIVVISAHWEAELPIQITARPVHSVIYDFGGFPNELYHLRYDAPGSPETVDLVEDLLGREGWKTKRNTQRGLDHGAWVPLRLMYPAADVPVVEISLPSQLAPAKLYSLGQALTALAAHQILFLGSGGVVHNLGRVDFAHRHRVPDAWATEFDQWVWQRLQAREDEKIIAYASEAPHASLAVPPHGTEHFAPLWVVLGAAGQRKGVENIFDGFDFANLSLRCFACVV